MEKSTSREEEEQVSLQDLPHLFLDNQLQLLLKTDTSLTARLCCSCKLLQKHLSSLLSSCPDLKQLMVARRNAVVRAALRQAKTRTVRSDATLLTTLWLAAGSVSFAVTNLDSPGVHSPLNILPLLVLGYTVAVLARKRSHSHAKMLGLLLDFSLSYASNIAITTQVGIRFTLASVGLLKQILDPTQSRIVSRQMIYCSEWIEWDVRLVLLLAPNSIRI